MGSPGCLQDILTREDIVKVRGVSDKAWVVSNSVIHVLQQVGTLHASHL
jgi:hypothetical protein